MSFKNIDELTFSDEEDDSEDGITITKEKQSEVAVKVDSGTSNLGSKRSWKSSYSDSDESESDSESITATNGVEVDVDSNTTAGIAPNIPNAALLLEGKAVGINGKASFLRGPEKGFVAPTISKVEETVNSKGSKSEKQSTHGKDKRERNVKDQFDHAVVDKVSVDVPKKGVSGPVGRDKKGESAKDRVKRQRLAGQSGIGSDFRTWKSDEEMRQRQQYD